MIDCSLPELALQGGAQSAPQSGNKASNRTGEELQNFSKFVENKRTVTDAAPENNEDETLTQREAAKDPVDGKWMGNLLYLTQMAQQSEAESSAADASLPSCVEGEEAMDLEMNIKTPVAINLDDGEADPAQTKTSLDKVTAAPIEFSKQATSRDKENSDQTSAKSNNEKLKIALGVQNASDTGNPSSAPTSKIAALAGSALSSSESTALNQAQSHRQDFSNLIVPGQKGAGNLEIGDKIISKNIATMPMIGEGSSLVAIDGVDIIRARKQADLTVLQLQLHPDNLGEVEAKLRLDKDHLSVELSAAKSDTAKLLAKDHHLLVQTLEKAGFGGELRLSISIIERSGAGFQPVHSSSSLQAGAQNMSGNHEEAQNGRQYTEADSGFSSSNRDKNSHQPQENSDNSIVKFSEKKPTLERLPNAFGSSRRLIV